ncbi:hypothetical protein BD289DRAFT_118289 [Coniella lustricola]|uniref:Secreted protein n=1 Tax=Coniella lustricola TaxID=2025994 RepID=A0A2T3AG62_9PEZI|nr:hypothetical protein BD289DRAFT_118289 [Coniella lustricola]
MNGRNASNSIQYLMLVFAAYSLLSRVASLATAGPTPPQTFFWGPLTAPHFYPQPLSFALTARYGTAKAATIQLGRCRLPGQQRTHRIKYMCRTK